MSSRGTAAAAHRPLLLLLLRGACHGTDLGLFFGADDESDEDRDNREAAAAAVCRQCPVRIQCLNYAVGRPERYGVWGGMGEKERALERRRRLRRARARRTAA